MSSTPEPSFDEIVIRRDGEWHALSVAQFFDLPLSLRIRHVIERSIVFKRQGQEVDQKSALAVLRRMSIAPRSG
jgi:hypothetical protein